MKKILILLLYVSFLLTGCSKLVSTETKNVEVTITDTYHKASWMQPVSTGKFTTWITHPAVWRVYVEYDGAEYTIDGADTYKLFEDKIGQTVTGILEIRKYDDGTSKYDIVRLVKKE